MDLSDSRPGHHPRWHRGRNPAPDRASHVAPENRPPVPLPLPRWTAMGARVGASPRRGSLPPVRAESASTTALSRPARDSLTLRPGRLLDPPRGSVVPRASTGRIAPSPSRVATKVYRHFLGWNFHPLVSLRLRGAP